MCGMHLASFSSSSVYGNAYIVWDDSDGAVLVDCGTPLRVLIRGFEALGLAPEDVRGVFITHEHEDHIRSLCLKEPFPERFSVPVYASPLFWDWYFRSGYRLDMGLVRTIEDGERVKLEGFQIHAFRKPHDAVDPLSFVVAGKEGRVALMTDMGHVPSRIASLVHGVEYLVIEANHDVQMELSSGRPPALVSRILGEHGHLSNAQAGAAISRIVSQDTRKVILAHLSVDCNTPEVARSECCRALRGTGFAGELHVAPVRDRAVYC